MAEDEENAKHIIGVVEKRSNDDDKRRRKWKSWKKTDDFASSVRCFARRRLFVVMWFFVRWKIYILCVCYL